MNSKYRKTIIAGNWKMNKTVNDAREFVTDLARFMPQKRACEVALCVPFVNISSVVKAAKGTKIFTGAQNMHEKPSGAYTGEVSADMLTAVGAKYVIIGHSERRQYFGETDQTVRNKVNAALSAGLRPIVCVGETAEQREQGVTIEHIRTQVKIALKDVNEDMIKLVTIAYEPIWAIGTGRTASPAQADEMCGAIRDIVEELYDTDISCDVTIQYGGSVKPANATELMNMPEIDGALVGGASLKPEEFIQIVNF